MPIGLMLLCLLIPCAAMAEEPKPTPGKPAAVAKSPTTATTSIGRLPVGKSSVTVKLKQGNQLLLTDAVKINGRAAGGFWIIATDTDFCMVDVNVARQLNLHPTRGSAHRPATDIESMEVGELKIASQRQIYISQLSSTFAMMGGKLDGVLGSDVLGVLPFTLDFQSPSITWFDRSSFKPPTGATRSPLELRGRPETPGFPKEINPIIKAFYDANPQTGSPVMSAAINGGKCDLLVSTALTTSISLEPTFTADHQEVVDRAKGDVSVVTTVDIGRPMMGKVARLDLFGQSMRDPKGVIARVAGPNAGRLAKSPIDTNVDGTIGMRVLENFRLTFDLPGRSIWSEWRPRPTVEAQLAAGTLDPAARDAFDYTPLMVAASRDDIAGCAALFKSGAKIDAETSMGVNALHCALWVRGSATAKWLVAQPGGAKLVNGSTTIGETPVMIAAGMTDATVLPLLLKLGGDPSQPDRAGLMPLHLAARHNSPAAVKILADAKVNLDAPSRAGLTPLGLAAEHGSIEAFDALVAAGAKFRAFPKDDVALIHLAARTGQVAMVNHLLTKYAKSVTVDPLLPDGSTPLLLAAESGHAEVVALLLKSGARPSIAAEGLGRAMPLHVAARNGNPETIKLLLKARAPVDAPNKQGLTPLMAAADAGQTEAAAALLDGGASIEAKDTDGLTALHLAARENRPEMIHLLAKRGANVNVKGPRDATPLHLACLNGSAAAIKALIEDKANPKSITSGGVSPQDLARQSGSKVLIELLQTPVK